MEEAIEDLKSQKTPNFSATAKKYNIERTTLRRRFKGETVSYEEARSRSHRLLTNVQESVLIDYIHKLSDKELHPTPKIIQNLVEEFVRKPVGSRLVERFLKRHANELKNSYLRNIDHSRHVADNSRHFQHYLNTVRVLFFVLSCLYVQFD